MFLKTLTIQLLDSRIVERADMMNMYMAVKYTHFIY